MGPLRSQPLSEVRVRQVILYVIDRDVIVEGLLPGAMTMEVMCRSSGFVVLFILCNTSYVLNQFHR